MNETSRLFILVQKINAPYLYWFIQVGPHNGFFIINNHGKWGFKQYGEIYATLRF